MAPISQAQELVRDYSRLPAAPAPSTWTTSVPASAPHEDPPPPYLPPEVMYGLGS
ncbi:hypothetical protein [Angustibacter luteus]|uniref:Uncharacterized protein n=1 Tax=Angustibacter luteus TaxID=658456 RepID=A0ABW1J9Y6_9ACTN